MPKGVDLVVLSLFCRQHRLLELVLTFAVSVLFIGIEQAGVVLNEEMLRIELVGFTVAAHHHDRLVDIHSCHFSLRWIRENHLRLILDIHDHKQRALGQLSLY